MPRRPFSLPVSPTRSVRSMTSPAVWKPSPSGVASTMRRRRVRRRGATRLPGRWVIVDRRVGLDTRCSRRATWPHRRGRRTCTGRGRGGRSAGWSSSPLHAADQQERGRTSRPAASDAVRAGQRRSGRSGRIEALLHHRGDEQPVLGEHEPAAEAAPARRGRAVLGVEQPLVGPERSVEPHGVVEAGHEDVAGRERRAVGEQRRVEQRSCPTRR